MDIPPHLSFRDYLDCNTLALDIPFLGRGEARVPKMSPPDHLPQLILRPEVLAIPEVLIQRPLHLLSPVLGDRTLLWLRQALALREGGFYRLRRGRRREGPAEESPRSGPSRRGGDPGGEGAGGVLRVRAEPRDGVGAGRREADGRGGAAPALAVWGRGCAASPGSTVVLAVTTVLGEGHVFAMAQPHGSRPLPPPLLFP